MNANLIKGLVLGGAAATAIGAVAGYKSIAEQTRYARVLSVQEVTRTVETPRRSCTSESVVRRVPPRDPDRIAGTALGAVVGGVIGNQVVHGDARPLATIAGAAGGGYAGNRIQQRMQQGNTYVASEPRCRTVMDARQVADGYAVRYRLGDREGTVHMDHDPGARIPVRDGRLVLDEPTSRET